jgi:hypothetical protein
MPLNARDKILQQLSMVKKPDSLTPRLCRNLRSFKGGDDAPKIMQSAAKSRPTGVTIIGILTIIGGILMIGSGLTLAAVAAVIPVIGSMGDQTNAFQSQIPSSIPAEFIGVALLAVGIIFTIIGIISLVVAYGLFKAKKWAWTISVGLSIISIAMGVISIATGNIGSIVSIAISGVILYYLYKPHVKEYFGKQARIAEAKP